MTLPAMPALTDPVLIEKAARLLAPAQSVPSSVSSSDTPAGTGGTGRGVARSEAPKTPTGRVAPQSEKQPTPTRSRRGRSERPVVPGRKAG